MLPKWHSCKPARKVGLAAACSACEMRTAKREMRQPAARLNRKGAALQFGYSAPTLIGLEYGKQSAGREERRGGLRVPDYIEL